MLKDAKSCQKGLNAGAIEDWGPGARGLDHS